jgi:hypothetical protein
MPKKTTPETEPTPEAALELAPVPEATPATVSEAAAALGRRARGVPKTITEERREELRAAAAHARGFRVRARPAPAPEATPAPAPQPPTTGRRITARVVAPEVPTTGRRVAPRIVAPTPGDVAAFGRG